MQGKSFVLARAILVMKLGMQGKLGSGNLDVKRHRSPASEYVHHIRMMLRKEEPDGHVLASGETASARTLIEWAFDNVGIQMCWEWEDIARMGYYELSVRRLVEIRSAALRPL